MQNGPHVFKVDHTGFCVFSKLFTQTFLIGRGDVTFPHVTYTKPSQNVEKLTCVHGRFKFKEQAPASLAAVKLDLALVRRAGYFPACWQIFAAGQRGRAGRGGRGQHNA